jgi:hypothetical protein
LLRVTDIWKLVFFVLYEWMWFRFNPTMNKRQALPTFQLFVESAFTTNPFPGDLEPKNRKKYKH